MYAPLQAPRLYPLRDPPQHHTRNPTTPLTNTMPPTQPLQSNLQVGLVTSVTYLTCAYALPALFTLKLCGDIIGSWERVLLWSLLPMTVILSGVGLWGSINALLNDLGGGEGWGQGLGGMLEALRTVVPV